MFGRRTKSPDTDADAGLDAEKLAGKGRPTPTRKEAEAARKQRLTPPRGRKELAARQREQTRQARAKRQLALQGGDDAYLPARDKGPVKAFIRDFVDTRRCIGEIMLPLFFLIFLLVVALPGAYRFSSVGWVLLVLLMAADAVRIAAGSKTAVRQRFGADTSTKGLAMYAVMRAWQMRRLRLPKPRVKHGAKI